MKLLKTILLLALCLALPTLALAEATPTSLEELLMTPATLTVTGSAQVTVEADQAQVTLGVVTKAPTVEEASNQNAKALAAVIDALKAAGVAEGDMVTENFSVNAQYDYSYGKIDDDQSVMGYQVSNLLRVTVTDVTRLGALVDAGMKAGANECYGISFQSTKAAEANDQALQAAVAEGARKAQLIAAASGHQLGSLISLEENGNAHGGVAYAMTMDAAKSSTTILADGLTFTATLTMTYEMR